MWRQSGLAYVLMLMVACAAPYRAPIDLNEVADDKTYGYSQHNPVKLGGAAEGEKAKHREAFFAALRGPKGQAVSYISNGTCCMFDLDPAGKSTGELEVFLVSYPGIPKPVLLYLDHYHFETPKSPIGFGLTPGPSSPSAPPR